MPPFKLPDDLKFNAAKIENPRAYVRERGCDSWLYLCGEEFASMEGGMSYADVEAAVDHAALVVSDPPRTLNLELARAHVKALDELPRPTLISCRVGPRASAVAYLYAGLRSGAAPDDVLAAAAADGAPFSTFEDYRAWVTSSMLALRKNGDDG